ncbi:phosphatase PAP2 family protein [Salipiger aestuarii]|uniref:Undecaprenyl-diphosphatase n=1 Tax=Salipiger aestuarii TaxID=568098 RepID=A0A327XW20_9RHOB|nr:phosphatase PAP2 family protein [Salipiger aestuarii]EIE51276.1 phosphoesterase [Citreicella sp. 357]KAA8607775.1 PA-phosphatase [Salipiger aestuarii]KAB2538814.1 PA-phosphatase [Salipiger aestuarii]RAK12361.1 undecaprenyl-diphosphatase [Salipiger aestuarii]
MPSFLSALWRRTEAATLVGIVVIAGALWGFVALAAEMVEGDLHAFDEAVLMALRQPGDPAMPVGGSQVQVAMRDLTALGGVSVLTILVLVVTGYLLLLRQRHAAGLLLIAILGGQALSHLAKSGFDRPRPDLVPHGVDVATASFPSGHSMMSAVTYLTLAVMLARTQRLWRLRVFFVVVAALLAMTVGISRIYLGVHWPSDVLAGWALGAAWALGVWLMARWLARRGRIEPETTAPEDPAPERGSGL